MKRRICFRADGGAKMGLGHVMRSCVLVELLKNKYDCHFFIREPMPFLAEVITKAGAQIHVLTQMDYQVEASTLADSFSVEDIVVLDGYSFGTSYQKIFIEKGCKVVSIDDIHASHFVADVVINHGPGIEQSDYSAETYTRFFLGPGYALINDSFRQMARKHREIEALRRCLICFGGTDFNNITLKVLQLIKEGNYKIEIDVITGSAYTGFENLRSFLTLHKDVRWQRGISQEDMLELMAAADLVICPASTILYEACAVGTGILTGYYVDNQERIYDGFLKLDCVFGLGDWNAITGQSFSSIFSALKIQDINRQIDIQKKVIDGFSDKRYKEIFEAL